MYYPIMSCDDPCYPIKIYILMHKLRAAVQYWGVGGGKIAMVTTQWVTTSYVWYCQVVLPKWYTVTSEGAGVLRNLGYVIA